MGAKGGLENKSDIWEFSSETDPTEDSIRELNISSDWNVVGGSTVGLDQEERSERGTSLDGDIKPLDEGGDD